LLDTLITSKTRVKLLLKFFLNSKTTSYLRGLEEEFGESSNAIRVELNRFEDAGLLTTELEGNKKLFKANTKHPLFKDINNILLKHVGIDKVVENVIENLGNLELVYLSGSFAKGSDSNIIDIILVGNIDRQYLSQLVEKAEKLISRKIRYVTYAMEDLNKINQEPQPLLLLWKSA
jgi:predicted nucleotidyltransferase